MNKRLEKSLEPILLGGMIIFLGIMFLIFIIEHLFIRNPIRFIKNIFKRKRRRRRV
tara:strand:+ start:300 stop:467 length:168 start_codon:yes stop_codon:yes gene_type:complete